MFFAKNTDVKIFAGDLTRRIFQSKTVIAVKTFIFHPKTIIGCLANLFN